MGSQRKWMLKKNSRCEKRISNLGSEKVKQKCVKNVEKTVYNGQAVNCSRSTRHVSQKTVKKSIHVRFPCGKRGKFVSTAYLYEKKPTIRDMFQSIFEVSSLTNKSMVVFIGVVVVVGGFIVAVAVVVVSGLISIIVVNGVVSVIVVRVVNGVNTRNNEAIDNSPFLVMNVTYCHVKLDILMLYSIAQANKSSLSCPSIKNSVYLLCESHTHPFLWCSTNSILSKHIAEARYELKQTYISRKGMNELSEKTINFILNKTVKINKFNCCRYNDYQLEKCGIKRYKKLSSLLLMKGCDIELNPGPNKTTLITQNCRGLKKDSKFKQLINRIYKEHSNCHNLIVALQDMISILP